jgi:hypothetical protein
MSEMGEEGQDTVSSGDEGGSESELIVTGFWKAFPGA